MTDGQTQMQKEARFYLAGRHADDVQYWGSVVVVMPLSNMKVLVER